MPHYAVAKGKNTGVYNSWSECESQVKGYGGAQFKKFATRSEAQEFVANNSNQSGSSSGSSNYSPGYSGHSSRSYSDHSYSYSGGRSTSSGNSFSTDGDGYTNVYTDGSCINNGTKSAKAGYGISFGPDHPLNASEPVYGRATNNTGEIQGATEAIKRAHGAGIDKLAINTDSKFLIDSATNWMEGWKKNGWKTASGSPVKNEADFKALDSAMDLMDVKFKHVKGHHGNRGNEEADKLAKQGAEQYNLKK